MPKRPRDSAPSAWEAEPVIDWLMEDGRFSSDLDELVAELGKRLVTAGAPISRVRLSMRTLHPLITGVTSVWERDRATVQWIETPHGLEGRAGYKGSPFEIILRTLSPFRKRLSDGLSAADHNVLHELRARGATDYFGVPMRLADGLSPILVLVTDAPEGFSDRDIEGFTNIAAFLAPIAEVFRLRRLSLAVAEAYLGRRTGHRVLEGQITRGHVEKINAAILISDIRDWTGLNDRLPAETAVDLANRCFDVLANAVEANGGEILKFVGDGLLAIFPISDGDHGAGTVCEQALAAARAALGAVEQSDPPIGARFGIGLNFGEVLYGNIGSATRLDFTVMGQAVNIAARIEGLCDATGRPLLFSQQFADHLPEPAIPVTEALLKGQKEKSAILTATEYA